jgi:DNA-binding CsgD family transcriptional regulator
MKKMLEEDGDFAVSSMYSDLPAFRARAKNLPFDIFLINPALIHAHKPFAIRELFPDYSQTVAAALLYGYADSDTLAGFDCVLSIYDDSLKMRNKLQHAVKTFVNYSETSIENVDLSDREKEILVSVAQGLTNREIADKHCISIHTVISHRKNITRKTGIKTISGLTIYAVFNGLISQEEL